MNLCYWIGLRVSVNVWFSKYIWLYLEIKMSVCILWMHIYSLALSLRGPRSCSNTLRPLSTLVPRPWYSNTTLH